MARIYKAAIIGCGSIAGGYQSNDPKDKSVLTHAKAYAVHRQASIIAAVDADRKKLNKFCREWKIPASYTGIQRMLAEEKPDIVSICTPSQTHQDILRLCAGCRDVKAIWCEKPLGTDYNFIKNLFKNKNKIFYVNHLRRWDKAIEKIRHFIRSKFLGEPLLFICNCSKDFFENGSHIIDLMYYLLEAPETIKVVSAARVNKDKKNRIFPDIYMEFANKMRVYIFRSNIEFNCFDLDFLFTQGKIKSFDNGFNFKFYTVVPSGRFPGHNWISAQGKRIPSDLNRSMLRILDNIVRSLDSGADLRNNLDFELESFRIFCGVYDKIEEFLKCQD